MADMYDISVTSMKIGVAIPIVNNSFRFWDDPGTWQDPTGWTAGGGNVSLYRYQDPISNGYWLGYDDNAALRISDFATIPNDTTHETYSDTKRFWPDNAHTLASTLTIYFNMAWGFNNNATTPGGSALNHFVIQIGNNSSLASVQEVTLVADVSASTAQTGFTLASGTKNISTNSGAAVWARARHVWRDWTGVSRLDFQCDCIGIMFNPFDYTTGYLELTNVHPANGPVFTPQNFIRESKTPMGTSRRSDLSGGHEKYQLDFELRNESSTTYENLKRFYDINRGTPGIPGVPLLIEPNIPGIPPTLMVNMVGNQFPIRRQTSRAERYGGTLTFETVW
jgi:hypothetical protein